MLSLADLDRLAKDTGCEVHDDCLTCPLPECIYETKKQRNPQARTGKIRQLYPDKSIEELAHMFGVTSGTIYRDLRGSNGST